LPAVQPPIACFLRDWPRHYKGPRTNEEFETAYEDINDGLAKLISTVQSQLDLPVQLLPMHTLPIGGDDRIFARSLAKKISLGRETSSVSVPNRHVTPWQIVMAMQNAACCICMRFHSVVFASTLGRPFIAIDYTNNGKIGAFLRSRGQTDRMISIDDVISGQATQRVTDLLTSFRGQVSIAG
jgi:polysaccharide pyruvyl transferase WcaK-like protein